MSQLCECAQRQERPEEEGFGQGPDSAVTNYPGEDRPSPARLTLILPECDAQLPPTSTPPD